MKDRDNRHLRSAVGASQSPSRSPKSRLYGTESKLVDRAGLADASLPQSQEATRTLPPTATASPERLDNADWDAAEIQRFRGPRWLFAWALAWQFWVVAVLAGAGTAGYLAANSLFKLSALPSCPSLFLPLASGSVRLYCAQLAADKQTTESLLDAIHWVEMLPQNHPLRAEVDRKIEEWSLQILDLVEDTVQEGYLEQGIADARRIPKYVQAYKLVEERIAKWESIWDRGKKIVAEAEKLMMDSKWALAFRAASKLTTLPNKYWATTRYNQMVERIRVAQEESAKLDKAYALLKQGGTDNLFEAIKLAREIKSESTAYREAQKLVEDAGKKLLEIAMERLEAGDWSGATEITNRIPANLNIQEEIKDINSLAEAGMRAGSGSVDGLQAAIDAAKGIPPGRPLYERAQRLIGRWELEIQDVQTLAKAEELADGGGINYLTAAIAKARLIPPSNPRYRQAQARIEQWKEQIQARESPSITSVSSYPESESSTDLQRALNDARADLPAGVSPSEEPMVRSRPVQPETPPTSAARDRKTVTSLDENPGQSPDGDRGRLELEQARQMARGGTASGISSAIITAQQVPPNSPFYNQSVQEINSWSERILSMAVEQANSDLSQAIETAQKVPDGTSAYAAARAQIEKWQQQLTPKIPTPPAINGEPPSPDAAPVDFPL